MKQEKLQINYIIQKEMKKKRKRKDSGELYWFTLAYFHIQHLIEHGADLNLLPLAWFYILWHIFNVITGNELLSNTSPI